VSRADFSMATRQITSEAKRFCCQHWPSKNRALCEIQPTQFIWVLNFLCCHFSCLVYYLHCCVSRRRFYGHKAN